jgi:hypothetical protein
MCVHVSCQANTLSCVRFHFIHCGTYIYTYVNARTRTHTQVRALVAERSAGSSAAPQAGEGGRKAEASLKALASIPLVQRLGNYEAAIYGDAGKVPKVCLLACVSVCA